MDKPVDQLRRSYVRSELVESEADADPMRLFDHWFDAAVRAGLLEPNAMTLATVDAAGKPSVRVLLLKGYDERGLLFFSNYLSRKGRELEANPHAALCFWWGDLERQVRVEGLVSRVSEAESEAYFRTRPRDSQLGACVSNQSDVIAGREVLEDRLAALTREHPGSVPRPAHWGGYRLWPTVMEFWQGRPSRLHDRLLYTRADSGAWARVRLAP